MDGATRPMMISCITDFVGLSVCGSVHALKGNRLELSTPTSVNIKRIAFAQNASILNSEVQDLKITWLFSVLSVVCILFVYYRASTHGVYGVRPSQLAVLLPQRCSQVSADHFMRRTVSNRRGTVAASTQVGTADM